MYLYLSGVTGNPNDHRFGDGIDDNGDGLIESGDSRSNQFYSDVMTRNFNDKDWRDVSAVLDHAIIMFGDLKTWFAYQIKAKNLVKGHVAEYIIDTMGYVLDGKRTMSQESWLTLLTMTKGKAVIGNANYMSYAHDLLDRLYNYTDYELFQLWLSKRSGVLDIIDTLFILFGVPIQKDLREPV